MNRITAASCWLAVLLTVLWTGLLPGQSVTPGDGWAAAELPAPADVNADRWQRLVGQLKAGGFSADAARECLAPVREAARQGIPSEPVLARIEEGAVKGAQAKALRDAGRQRLASLGSAAAVLREAGYGDRNARHDELMKSTALAIESGISAEALRMLLTQEKGGQSERMRSIVEAGETMRLSGMDEAIVVRMMNDFRERNMRRAEVIRASRFAVQQHKAHVEGARIREQLWDGTGTAGRWGRGGSAPGGGPGPGAGGPADHGGGPAGVGGTGPGGTGPGGSGAGGESGQGGPSVPPGGKPADAGGGGHGGGADGSGSGGTSSQQINALSDAGSMGSTRNKGR